MGKLKDLTGLRFGKLTVIKLDYTNKHRQSMWLCKCDCGNTITVLGNDLKRHHTLSCGCTNKTQQGLTSMYPRLYRIWRKMIERCENSKCNTYYNYGERGITVCNEWHDFNTFREWSLNNGYKDNLTIDRIDYTGNYEPNNCRWITQKEQCNNKRNNHYITYNGETRTIKEWESIKNLPKDVIQQRIKKLNWSIKDALEIPYKQKRKK